MTTRVSQETYAAFLAKCSNKGCSPYEYLKELVEVDLGLVDPSKPVQTELTEQELKENGRNDEERISIVS